MGGSIAWTIREANGNEHRMKRWTNIIPETITDGFLAGDPALFEEAMESYLNMKADWERNGPDGPFEHPMTTAYAPYPFGLQPAEYGFIVTDFQTKTLISCNHYTSFDHIWVMRSMFNADPDDEEDQYADRIARFTRMFEEGRILTLWSFDRTNRHMNKLVPPVSTSFNDLVEKSCKLVDDHMVTFDVQPPAGWTFLHFNSDRTDTRQQAFQAVEALGFKVSEEERAEWVEWIAWPSQEFEDEDA